jgi:hypothetical protein
MIMQACKNHDKCIVIFERVDCPLCKAEEVVKTAWEEVEMSLTRFKRLKQKLEEVIFDLD